MAAIPASTHRKSSGSSDERATDIPKPPSSSAKLAAVVRRLFTRRQYAGALPHTQDHAHPCKGCSVPLHVWSCQSTTRALVTRFAGTAQPLCMSWAKYAVHRGAKGWSPTCDSASASKQNHHMRHSCHQPRDYSPPRYLLMGAPVVGCHQGDGLCVAPALQPPLDKPGGVAVRHTQAVRARLQAGCGRRRSWLRQVASLLQAHDAPQHACTRSRRCQAT